MAYEVTATRKRPQDFTKLVGQEFVVSTIENAIASNRIAHAYLFSGPRGVGKTSSARLLAKALNCENGPSAKPCMTCASCTEINTGSSTDVIEIDGASNTSVNDIRIIKEEVMFPPQGSRYKIYIIDEVHMLSTSAFNALLKTIEEPPEYIIFIFATTEIQKVPATIRSRCQQFHFQLISLDTIKGCIKEASSEMNIKIDEDALFFIAKEAQGSMRDAYTLFDQIAAFSQDHITLEKIREKIGIIGNDQIKNILEKAIFGQTNEALEDLSASLKKGISIEQMIKDFAAYFRALLFSKVGIKSDEILNMRSEDLSQNILNSITAKQLEAALKYLLDLYRDIRYSLDSRYELEIFISRLSSLIKLVSNDELFTKVEALKNDILKGKSTIVKEKEIIRVESKTYVQNATVVAPPQETVVSPVVVAPVERVVIPTEKPIATVVTPVETVVAPVEVKVEPIETVVAPVEVLPEVNAKLPLEEVLDFEEMSHECTSNVLGFAATLRAVLSWELLDNTLVLYVDSSMRKEILSKDVMTIRNYLKEKSDFTGPVVIDVKKKQFRKASSELEFVNRIFKGQIVLKEGK